MIAREKIILKSLEDNNIETVISETVEQPVIVQKESEVEKTLSRIDPMALSPIDALSTLIELKKLL